MAFNSVQFAALLAVTLGGSVAALIAGIGLVRDVARRLNVRELQPLIVLGARSAVAGGLTFVLVRMAHSLAAIHQSTLGQILRLGIGTVVAAAVFAGMLTLLGHQWPIELVRSAEGEAETA